MVQIGLIGRLGADAQCLEAGERFALHFNVCVNVQKKDANGTYYDLPQWYRVTYFARTKALLTYLRKGVQIYLAGEPVVETYMSKNTGATATTVSITATKIELLGGGKEAENETL